MQERSEGTLKRRKQRKEVIVTEEKKVHSDKKKFYRSLKINPSKESVEEIKAKLQARDDLRKESIHIFREAAKLGAKEVFEAILAVNDEHAYFDINAGNPPAIFYIISHAYFELLPALLKQPQLELRIKLNNKRLMHYMADLLKNEIDPEMQENYKMTMRLLIKDSRVDLHSQNTQKFTVAGKLYGTLYRTLKNDIEEKKPFRIQESRLSSQIDRADLDDFIVDLNTQITSEEISEKERDKMIEALIRVNLSRGEKFQSIQDILNYHSGRNYSLMESLVAPIPGYVDGFTTEDTYKAFACAAGFGYETVISHYLRTMNDIMMPYHFYGDDPVQRATRNGHLVIVRHLLESRHHFASNTSLSGTGAPLHLAVAGYMSAESTEQRENYKKIIFLLIDDGRIKVNKKDKVGLMPIDYLDPDKGDDPDEINEIRDKIINVPESRISYACFDPKSVSREKVDEFNRTLDAEINRLFKRPRFFGRASKAYAIRFSLYSLHKPQKKYLSFDEMLDHQPGNSKTSLRIALQRRRFSFFDASVDQMRRLLEPCVGAKPRKQSSSYTAIERVVKGC